jgi:hypothetical protein
MLRVTLEIDNHTAHSCSPLEFLRDYILQQVTEDIFTSNKVAWYQTPYAKIEVVEVEQV